MLILEIVATPIRFEAEEEPQKFKRIPLNPMNQARWLAVHSIHLALLFGLFDIW